MVWSDECYVERGSGRRKTWVFRKPGDRYRPDLIQGVKKGKDIRVMIWAAFSGHLQSRAVVLQRDPSSTRNRVTANVYLEMLRKELPFLMLDDDAVFQQDNAPIHKSRKVLEWFMEAGFKIMDWPPYSPDFNPIEHCWFSLKENVYITFPELLDLRGGRSRIEKELGEACLAAWDTLKDELFESLV